MLEPIGRSEIAGVLSRVEHTGSSILDQKMLEFRLEGLDKQSAFQFSKRLYTMYVYSRAYEFVPAFVTISPIQ